MIEGSCNLQWMRPSELSQHDIEQIRNAAIAFEGCLRALLAPGRESSLALTKLEETVMWATKSVCVAGKK